MLRNIRILSNICNKNYIKNSEANSSISKWTNRGLLNLTVNCDTCRENQFNSFHTNLPRSARLMFDRKTYDRHNRGNDDGSLGAKSMELDSLIKRSSDCFPDEDLPNRLYDGVPFKELPVVTIFSSKNNTIMSFSNHKGMVQTSWSCGCEGYRNTKKGTNIAAQATATTLSQRIINLGIRNVRVTLNGLGPGRLSALRGVQLSGLNIISLTDTTPFTDCPPRPKKQRRI